MITIFAATLIASAPTTTAISWAGRSGQAEALADLSSGKPVKLYVRAIGGERVTGEAPGLLNCDPEGGDIPTNMLDRLMSLHADFSEGVRYTSQQLNGIQSAVLFARAYNVTMFEVRRSEVLKICPAATRDTRS